MSLGEILSYGKKLWNAPAPISAEQTYKALDLTVKVTVVAIFTIPKDLLPTGSFTVLTLLSAAREVLPAAMKVLSKDQSLKTIAKCAGLTALQLAPAVIDAIVPPKQTISSELNDTYCTKGSETEKIFKTFQECLIKNGTEISYCFQYNTPVVQSVTLTLPCRAGAETQGSIFFKSDGTITFFRAHSKHHVLTRGSIEKQFYKARNLLGFFDKPHTLTCSKQLEVKITVYQGEDFCQLTQLRPPQLNLGSKPFCVITAAPKPKEEFVSKEQFITCLEKTPDQFSVDNSAAQYPLPSHIKPVLKTEITTMENGQQYKDTKITSYVTTNPCEQGFLPKTQCSKLPEEELIDPHPLPLAWFPKKK